MSSQGRMRLEWTLSLPSVTTRRTRCAPYGQATRRQHIGAFLNQQRLQGQRKKYRRRFGTLSFSSIGGSIFFYPYLTAPSTDGRFRRSSITWFANEIRSSSAHDGRVCGNRISSDGGRCSWDYGRATCRGQCCDRLTHEHDCHWIGLSGADAYVRTYFGSALQPRCLVIGCMAEGHALARNSVLHHRPSPRRLRWSSQRSRNVRIASVFSIATQSQRSSADVQRIYRNIWFAFGDLGLFATALIDRAPCCGGVHHGGLLVHGFNIVCESCRDSGKSGD